MLQKLLIGAWFGFVCIGELYFSRVSNFAIYEKRYPIFIYIVVLVADAIPLTTGQWWITLGALLPAIFVGTTVIDRKLFKRWAESRRRLAKERKEPFRPRNGDQR
jgi:hypothetical protein